MSRMSKTLSVVFTLALVGVSALSLAARPQGKTIAPAAEAPRPYLASFPVDASSYDSVRDLEHWIVDDVGLPDGRSLQLDLEGFDVLKPDATLVAETPKGPVALPRPDVALFRGQARGEAGSRAFVSVSPYGVYGYVLLDDGQFIISTGPAGQALASLIFNPQTLPDGLIKWAEFRCGDDDGLLRPPGTWDSGGDGGIAGTPPCRTADLAIETDQEFTADIFGGSTSAATAYINTLIGAVSEIYTNDINLSYNIAYLRLWTTSDPWNQGDTVNQLYQFQDYWNANMTGVQRSGAHYISGRALGGGVAYVDALCWPEYDYSLIANMGGFFPYPIEDNHDQNWDLMVSAHELGHQCGAPHTHNLNPPVDCCGGEYGGNCGGTQDCSVTPNGTIMSYCHLCPGGMTNVLMQFHVRNINEQLLPYLTNEAPCNLIGGGVTITDQPDSVTTCSGGPVVFGVAATTNDPPLTYQWRKAGVNLSNGGNVSGATTDTLTLDPIDGSDDGSYDVVINSAGTCGPVTSAAATLTAGTLTAVPFTETWPSTSFDGGKWVTLIGSPTIDTAGPSEPSSPNSLHLELTDGVESACMDLSGLSGATFSYYWARSSTENGDDLEVYYADDSGAWVLLTTHLSGSSSSSYTQASHNLPPAALHSSFRIKFQASCSSVNDEWYVDDINVDAPCADPSVTSHPGSATECAGSSVTFNVSATGTGSLSYQWRKDGGDIDGATGDSYDINPITPGDAGDYDCVVTDSCGSVDSDDATLTVDAAPTVLDHPDNLLIFGAGHVAVFSVTADDPGATVQWRHDGVNLADGPTGSGSTISGATTATLTITDVQPDDGGFYDVVVTNGCGSVDSDDARLRIRWPVPATPIRRDP